MRRRIVLLVAGVIAVVVLAFVIPLALLVRHVVYSDATDALRAETNQVANYLHSNVTASLPTATEISGYLATLPSSRRASVDIGDGIVLGRAAPGNVDDLPPVAQFDRDQPPGHDGPPQPTLTRYHGGELSQLPVLSDRGQPGSVGTVTVRVYASDGELHSGERGWWLLLGGSSLALLLLGIGAAELMTRRLVRPLLRTADTAHQMSAGDTAARAPVEGPREIADVGAALNRLGDRIDELIADERETVADLSHRMRTPLTALRLDAEALGDPAEAERMGEHVTALERTLTAIIHAARRPQREGRLPACDATDVVSRRVEFWSALAEDQDRIATVALPAAPLPVRASSDDLAAAVDALLENVLAHTPEGTPFAVTLEPTADGARLIVSDGGPGLPTDALVRGRSDRGSTGLGLDIARRCVEAGGGTFDTGSGPHGGAQVTLDFRAP
jgi:signal transduction histidine kinase